MSFCPNCGTQAAGRFCPNCGTELGAGGAASAAGAGGGSTYVPPATPISAPGLDQNVAAALCYLLGFITGIIFLFLSPYNKNRLIRFHAFQSIFLSIAVFIADVIFGIFTGVLYAVHAGALGRLLWPLYQLALFVGWLYLMYSAYTRRKIVVPVIGPLAEKQV